MYGSERTIQVSAQYICSSSNNEITCILNNSF